MSTVLEARESSTQYLSLLQLSAVKHFDLLTAASGGMNGLRELILALAVRGKLVPQDSDDEPARVLLQRIHAEKVRLIAEGKLKREKALPTIEDKEKPYVLPQGWEFARLGHLIHSIKSGGTPSKQNPDFWDGDIPWASVKDLGVGTSLSETQDHITQAGLDAGSCLAAAGSILICTRMGLGKIGEALIDVAINQDLKAIALAPQINKKYFINFFKTLAIVGSGMTVAGIKQDELLGFVVPVPPCAEQARIVARVDELMHLCDALEAKGRLEAEQHAHLLSTLLGTLTNSSTPEELAANWQRVADHFDLLLDRPEAVDALEQTILQLAVRGLLVPQDSSEESASHLVRRIRSHREQQVKAGLAKREKPVTPLSQADLPFEVPAGWEWVRFDELIEPAKPISYGVLVPGPEVSGGVPFVRIADLSLTDPPARPEKSISMEVDAQYQRTRLEGGEILMGVVGSIGKLGVAPPSWAGANIARAICRIVPVGLVNKDFVLLLLQSELMRASFAGDTRTLAQPTLNVGLIRGSATPLPPIAEQSRIVARVTELRRLCGDLRQRLDRSGATHAALADALIDQALAT